jgi:hypothetical protein
MLLVAPYNACHCRPDELLNSGATWAMSFKQESIVRALNEA